MIAFYVSALSFFLLLFFSVIEIIHFTNKLDVPMMGCQTILFNAQSSMAKGLNKLLDLNQKIKLNLNAQKVARALQFFPHPAVIVAANRILALLKFIERLLVLRQKSILLKVKFDNFKYKTRLKQFFSKPETSSKLLYHDKFKLHLSKKKVSSISYLYNPKKNFKKLQKLRALWNFRYTSPLLKMNKDLFNLKNFNKNYECSATLIQEGDQWRASLIRDRPLWN